ncbi:YaaC family protein [Pontibacillus marinus]|uniref:YaaC n=1 Tax=Pontibacillus marinus BH030004 = DSM 16465 TaxID=1385511 RepID=A0A0A5G738_9BACI|nr:YaaC family protein [Pontibacillus marinus]KGX86973.1 hypothetical protein N783_10735 [Pontibacillus marinus BH030004 = DSM 16465]
MQNIQSIYTQLQSAPFTQKYLKECYKKQGFEDAEKKCFDNTYRFIYFLEHAETYYEQGRKAPLSIKPVLYFYGMSQLLKAALLTCRPDYPETTAVLAHGVSSRKRKKQNYTFLQDEVKIQHKGLFSYVSKHLFNVEHLLDQKFSMDELLRRIPEVDHVYQFPNKPSSFYTIGHQENPTLRVPIGILDDYHWTFSYFEQHMNQVLPNIKDVDQEENFIVINLDEPIGHLGRSFFYMDSQTNQLVLPKRRSLFSYVPEVLNHYILLYNLSMICRYETEWWGDVLHSFSSEDLVFIQAFLETTSEKIPRLMAHIFMD